jgi:diaminopimelate epimerase
VIPEGRQFYKLTGSGNDFVFVDVRQQPAGELERAEVIGAICARGSGVGADGIVFLDTGRQADVSIRYLNRDGSLAALCGNATLCTARLAAELGLVAWEREFTIETDSGPVSARFRDGVPEIDLQPIEEVQYRFDAELAAGERRIGFALVGVPHLVIHCENVDRAPVFERGRQLRHHPGLAHGANVNFLSYSEEGGWRIRTYERGVEMETLACGTGSVASAILMASWGLVAESVNLKTRSGRVLRVRQHRENEHWLASLSGEARLVFAGVLGEVAPNN